MTGRAVSVCCGKGLPSSPDGQIVAFTQGPAWECPGCGDIWLWGDTGEWFRDPEQDVE